VQSKAAGATAKTTILIVAPRQSGVANLTDSDNYAPDRAIRTFIQVVASFHPDCRATDGIVKTS
jgi:hypothetical protein